MPRMVVVLAQLRTHVRREICIGWNWRIARLEFIAGKSYGEKTSLSIDVWRKWHAANLQEVGFACRRMH